MGRALLIAVLLGILSNSVDTEVTGVFQQSYALFGVTPTTAEDIRFIRDVISQNTGIMCPSGVGPIGEEVQLMATQENFEYWQPQFVNMNVQLLADEADIIAMNGEPQDIVKSMHAQPAGRSIGRSKQEREYCTFSKVGNLKTCVPYLLRMKVAGGYMYLRISELNCHKSHFLMLTFVENVPNRPFKEPTSDEFKFIFEKIKEAPSSKEFYMRNSKHPNGIVSSKMNLIILEMKETSLKEYYFPKENKPHDGQVTCEKSNNGLYCLRVKNLPLYLEQFVDPVIGNFTTLLRDSKSGGKCTLFELIEAPAISIEATISGIQFTESLDSVLQQTEGQTITAFFKYKNGASGEDKVEIKAYHTNTDTFKTTFSRSYKFVQTFEFFANTPILNFKKTDVQGSESGGTTTTVVTKTTSYGIWGTQTIPPRKELEIATVFKFQKDLKIPFEANMTLYGFSKRLFKTENNFRDFELGRVHVQLLKEALFQQQFAPTFTSETKESVTTVISGTFTADFGLKILLVVQEKGNNVIPNYCKKNTTVHG